MGTALSAPGILALIVGAEKAAVKPGFVHWSSKLTVPVFRLRGPIGHMGLGIRGETDRPPWFSLKTASAMAAARSPSLEGTSGQRRQTQDWAAAAASLFLIKIPLAQTAAVRRISQLCGTD